MESSRVVVVHPAATLAVTEQSLRQQYPDFCPPWSSDIFLLWSSSGISRPSRRMAASLGGVAIFFADDAFEFAKLHASSSVISCLA